MNAINVISDINELIFFYQNYRPFSIFNYKKIWNLLILNVLYVCTILLLSYTNFFNSIYQKNLPLFELHVNPLVRPK